MDAAPLSKEAPPAAVEGALPSPAKQAVERRPSPDDDATGVRASGGGGEADDEQVERFYALLENIRAMRGMVGGATAAAGRKKRAREAEPPWRPAFRMEDFELDEVQSDAPCCGAKREKRESSRGARRPAEAAGRETTDGDEEEDGEEVVEVKRPRRRPQHKARRAVVLAAVDRLGGR